MSLGLGVTSADLLTFRAARSLGNGTPGNSDLTFFLGLSLHSELTFT